MHAEPRIASLVLELPRWAVVPLIQIQEEVVMRKSSALIAAALSVAAAIPAFAGEGHHCTADVQTCLDQMAAKMAKKGYMGLEFDKSTADGQYVVKKVIEGAPAARAGFKAGDAILVVNGAKWSDEEAMKKVDWSAGSQLTVKILRGAEKKDVTITLAKMPEEMVARYVGAHMIESHVAVATASDAGKP
jgi:S1-C subfamily serine protease